MPTAPEPRGSLSSSPSSSGSFPSPKRSSSGRGGLSSLSSSLSCGFGFCCSSPVSTPAVGFSVSPSLTTPLVVTGALNAPSTPVVVPQPAVGVRSCDGASGSSRTGNGARRGSFSPRCCGPPSPRTFLFHLEPMLFGSVDGVRSRRSRSTASLMRSLIDAFSVLSFALSLCRYVLRFICSSRSA